tara:strand:- start:327 stop:668 length:342 start_codon:yes stop_codon:yes gene_type:complete
LFVCGRLPRPSLQQWLDSNWVDTLGELSEDFDLALGEGLGTLYEDLDEQAETLATVHGIGWNLANEEVVWPLLERQWQSLGPKELHTVLAGELLPVLRGEGDPAAVRCDRWHA